MRLFFKALLLLLSITLPVYGSASIAIDSPCPMQTDGVKSGTCCQDTDHAKSGNPCKAGQECQTGALYQSVAALVISVVPQSTHVDSLPAMQLIAAAPTAVWRPPRSL